MTRCARELGQAEHLRFWDQALIWINKLRLEFKLSKFDKCEIELKQAWMSLKINKLYLHLDVPEEMAVAICYLRINEVNKEAN